jgi:hypothetical protein
MSKYKFALVIENDRSFISEKLFDALFAGCVPIYVGPSLNSLSLPPDLVIEAEPHLESVLEAFKEAQALDHENWLRDRNNFLTDHKVRNSNESQFVFEKMVEAILASS